MGEGSLGLVREFLEKTPHADKGRFARFRQALQICPTTAHDANSIIFCVDTFRLDFSVVLGLSWKRFSTAQGGCIVD